MFYKVLWVDKNVSSRVKYWPDVCRFVSIISHIKPAAVIFLYVGD